MTTYSIISSDGEWSYNYDDECCENHKQIGRTPYRFKDLALAIKCLQEDVEDDDYSIIDNSTGKKVK